MKNARRGEADQAAKLIPASALLDCLVQGEPAFAGAVVDDYERRGGVRPPEPRSRVQDQPNQHYRRKKSVDHRDARLGLEDTVAKGAAGS